jgi:hypothetical protein
LFINSFFIGLKHSVWIDDDDEDDDDEGDSTTGIPQSKVKKDDSRRRAAHTAAEQKRRNAIRVTAILHHKNHSLKFSPRKDTIPYKVLYLTVIYLIQ